MVKSKSPPNDSAQSKRVRGTDKELNDNKALDAFEAGVWRAARPPSGLPVRKPIVRGTNG